MMRNHSSQGSRRLPHWNIYHHPRWLKCCFPPELHVVTQMRNIPDIKPPKPKSRRVFVTASPRQRDLYMHHLSEIRKKKKIYNLRDTKVYNFWKLKCHNLVIIFRWHHHLHFMLSKCLNGTLDHYIKYYNNDFNIIFNILIQFPQ